MLVLLASPSWAAQRHHGGGGNSRTAHHKTSYAKGKTGRVIQCVAFAKAATDIELSGNARDWWRNADGVYARGARPEVGAVLAFKAVGRMPLGHVAVVSSLADSRTILIDQAHWNSGGITRDIEVKDVSENNDWTAVRVQIGRAGTYGSIYPTHGFIYARPDQGAMLANNTYAPVPQLDRAPADLRRARHRVVEVADAPRELTPSAPMDLRVSTSFADTAPDRGLR